MKIRFDRIRDIALGVVAALGVSIGVDSLDLSVFDAQDLASSQAFAQEGGRGGRGAWNGGNRSDRGQGGQRGGQRGNWNGGNRFDRGQGGGSGGQGGRQGGRPGGFGGFQMNAENFARLKASQFADRVKQNVGAERWAQWEAGDFSEGDTAAKMAADAQAKENGEAPEVDPNLTPEERAEAEARLRSGDVPEFVPEGQPHYSIESEADYYREAMAKREDVLEMTPTSTMRFYARYLIGKYDEDGDGLIQREEWENKLDKGQAVDLDGDWTLTNQEILYYIVRFAKDRTIYNPNPLRVNAKRSNFVVAADVEEETPMLIRPASAEPRRLSKEEAEAEDFINSGFASLADMTDDEVREMFKTDNPAMESVEDEELLDAFLTDMDESHVREYVTAPQVVRGVPVWFLARDRNGDGQLTLLEFAPNLSTNLMAQFGRLDKNGDNIITADEVRKATGGN